MAVNAGTIETYDNSVIREDLQEAYTMLSPTECPFQAAIGRKDVDNTLFEWPEVDLQSPDASNRVPEGEDAPSVDDATLATRYSNYTQISDKVVSTSHTSEAIDAAAEDVQKIAKQITLKLKELKRDMEIMLTDNVPAVPGAAQGATTRQTAGLRAFMRTNTARGATGADPTLSGGTDGYPNAAAVAGTPRPMTEALFNDVIEQCWQAGADPTIALVNSGNKRVISETFTASSTRYKDAIDKRLVNSIDIYTSDFGELQVVPTRFMRASNPGTDTAFSVMVLDPNFARVAFLETIRQKPLAETGHSRKRLIWGEYGLQVDSEKAHGEIADTTNAAT